MLKLRHTDNGNLLMIRQSHGYRYYYYYGPLSARRDGRAIGCRELAI